MPRIMSLSSWFFDKIRYSRIKLWFCTIFVCFCAVYHQFSIKRPEVHWRTVDFIRSYGYPDETHTVTTADGYLLEIHRIPHTKGSNTKPGPPVLFLHGFTCTSVFWVLQGPQKDLAFFISDQGYDVWLLNMRGSSYTRLQPSAKISFNDFSFQEMGVLDLPATIDYVLQITQKQNVTLIGHSMGTKLTFAGVSAKPELNQKINLFIGLGPLTYARPYSTLVHRGIARLFRIVKYLNIGEQMDKSEFFLKYGLRTWIPTLLLEPFFALFMKHISGSGTKCDIQVPSYVIMAQFPDATIYYTLLHSFQNLEKGKFLMRNFGPEKNQRVYNSTSPPEYNLTNYKVPTSVFLGEADTLTLPNIFLDEVPKFGTNLTIYTLPNYNHFDVLWSQEAITTVFPRIIRTIRSVIKPT